MNKLPIICGGYVGGCFIGGGGGEGTGGVGVLHWRCGKANMPTVCGL